MIFLHLPLVWEDTDSLLFGQRSFWLKQLLSSLVKWEADGVSWPPCILGGEEAGLKIGQLRWGDGQEEVALSCGFSVEEGWVRQSRRPASPSIADLSLTYPGNLQRA